MKRITLLFKLNLASPLIYHKHDIINYQLN